MKKINIYVWCSKAQVSKILNYFEDKGCFIDILTWHKTNPIPTCNGTYLNDTEYLIFAREKGVKVYGTYKTKFKYYVTPLNQKEKKLYKHPTIKPVFIIENLIVNSCLEGETVLDCFMGSGTTGVACKHTNRKFIGIEINDEYFEIAKGRINGEYDA
jgi:DNA modification methylase